MAMQYDTEYDYIIHVMYFSVWRYPLDSLFQLSRDGYLTIVLIVHYSCLLRMSMVVDVHRHEAELLLGVVAVAQHHWNDLCAIIILCTNKVID